MGNTIHCLKCPHFKKCKRKFDPGTDPIYSKMEILDDKIQLSNPIYCIRPKKK